MKYSALQRVRNVVCFAPPGKLMERHGKQCCGGEMVSDTMVCCGEGAYGQAYTWKANMSCCGQTFVRDDQSLCCTSDTRHIKVTVDNQVQIYKYSVFN